MRLLSEPLATVAVAVAAAGPGARGVRLGPSTTLRFGATNWSTPQRVEVNATAEALADGETDGRSRFLRAQLTHSARSADATYDARARDRARARDALGPRG